MADSKRTRLEKALEALTTRNQAKAAQMGETRAALEACKNALSTEGNNTKWEALADEHGRLSIRLAALIDELSVLSDKIRLARLDVNDYDLAEVNAEISRLLTESTEIRLKSTALRDDFRRMVAKRTSDIEDKQKILDVKTELSQLALAGELTTRQLEAAKRRRDKLTEERESIAG